MKKDNVVGLILAIFLLSGLFFVLTKSDKDELIKKEEKSSKIHMKEPTLSELDNTFEDASTYDYLKFEGNYEVDKVAQSEWDAEADMSGMMEGTVIRFKESVPYTVTIDKKDKVGEVNFVIDGKIIPYEVEEYIRPGFEQYIAYHIGIDPVKWNIPPEQHEVYVIVKDTKGRIVFVESMTFWVIE